MPSIDPRHTNFDIVPVCTPIGNQPDPILHLTCSKYGCRVSGAELHECMSVWCKRLIHYPCYQVICQRYSIPVLPGLQVTCRKKCFADFVKIQIAPPVPVSIVDLPWDKDGKMG